jgi:hypothetical protein
MKICKAEISIRREPLLVPLGPPQTLDDPGWNPGRCSWKPATNRLRITVMVLQVHPEAKLSYESININLDIKIFVNSFRHQDINRCKKIQDFWRWYISFRITLLLHFVHCLMFWSEYSDSVSSIGSNCLVNSLAFQLRMEQTNFHKPENWKYIESQQYYIHRASSLWRS